MNQHKFPTQIQAVKHLNELLQYATAFDLHYRIDKAESETYLDKLQTQVSIFYKDLPNPDTLSTIPFPAYDAYYDCLDNLMRSPLIRVDFGNQSLVNQGYIDVIMIAQHQLSLYAIKTR